MSKFDSPYEVDGPARTAWAVPFLFLVLWWLPLLFGAFGDCFRRRPLARRRARDAEDAVAAQQANDRHYEGDGHEHLGDGHYVGDGHEHLGDGHFVGDGHDHVGDTHVGETSRVPNMVGGARRRDAAAATAGVRAGRHRDDRDLTRGRDTDPAIGIYRRSKDLSNVARDIFLTLSVALLFAHISHGVTEGFMIILWTTAAVGLMWWSGALLAGRWNVLAPLWIIFFIIGAVALFALNFQHADTNHVHHDD